MTLVNKRPSGAGLALWKNFPAGVCISCLILLVVDVIRLFITRNTTTLDVNSHVRLTSDSSKVTLPLTASRQFPKSERGALQRVIHIHAPPGKATEGVWAHDVLCGPDKHSLRYIWPRETEPEKREPFERVLCARSSQTTQRHPCTLNPLTRGELFRPAKCVGYREGECSAMMSQDRMACGTVDFLVWLQTGNGSGGAFSNLPLATSSAHVAT